LQIYHKAGLVLQKKISYVFRSEQQVFVTPAKHNSPVTVLVTVVEVHEGDLFFAAAKCNTI
jgi:hypothetical protein